MRCGDEPSLIEYVWDKDDRRGENDVCYMLKELVTVLEILGEEQGPTTDNFNPCYAYPPPEFESLVSTSPQAPYNPQHRPYNPKRQHLPPPLHPSLLHFHFT